MMQGCVDETGRVRLTPPVKTWMRRHLNKPINDALIWEGATVFGLEAEYHNPGVCAHCVAGHLYDVLYRARAIKGAASGA
jgi:hypothetical protein